MCAFLPIFFFKKKRYGNNAVEMETTATYDIKSQEFVINSPTTLSQKYWITNSAVHARFLSSFFFYSLAVAFPLFFLLLFLSIYCESWFIYTHPRLHQILSVQLFKDLFFSPTVFFRINLNLKLKNAEKTKTP